MLRQVADSNNTVVATTADWGYIEYVRSWVCRLRRLRVVNFVVFCLDRRLFEHLQQERINSFFFEERGSANTVSAGALSWGSTGYTAIVRSKLHHHSMACLAPPGSSSFWPKL